MPFLRGDDETAGRRKARQLCGPDWMPLLTRNFHNHTKSKEVDILEEFRCNIN